MAKHARGIGKRIGGVSHEAMKVLLGHTWKGNIRELEQCVRGVLIRGTYRPRATLAAEHPAGDLVAAVAGGTLTAEQLLQRYCGLVFTQTGDNVSETARRLQLDRRTVRRHVAAARKAGPDG